MGKRSLAIIVTRADVSGGTNKVLAALLPHLAGSVTVTVIALSGNRPDTLPDGVSFHVADQGMHTQPAIAQLLKAPFAVSRLLDQIDPDALLSWLPRANVVSVLATRLVGERRRLILCERNNTRAHYEQNTRGRLFLRLLQHCYSYADVIICNSDQMAAQLRQEVGAGPVIQSIPNPVPVAEITVKGRRAEASKTGRDTVVTVGRLIPQKDHRTLITAFAALNHLDATLKIVGDGPLRAELRALAKQLHIDERVEFTGWVSDPLPIVSSADLFVLSSRFEGMPNALLEALALGVPCISTACPFGPREVLHDGEYGQLVDVGDWKSLATAIDAALSNPLALQQRALSARAFLEQWTAERIAGRYLNAIWN